LTCAPGFSAKRRIFVLLLRVIGLTVRNRPFGAGWDFGREDRRSAPPSNQGEFFDRAVTLSRRFWPVGPCSVLALITTVVAAPIAPVAASGQKRSSPSGNVLREARCYMKRSVKTGCCGARVAPRSRHPLYFSQRTRPLRANAVRLSGGMGRSLPGKLAHFDLHGSGIASGSPTVG